MEKISVTDAWSPTIADTTAAGSYQLVAYRTKYGIVRDRATIGGKPVAYTTLRSTYDNEASVLLGFEEFNDPDVITGPVAFQHAAYQIGYTFNWLYVDSKHTAYFNSGLDPTRAANVDPNLPIWGDAAYEWRNWNPDTNVVADTPFATHPQSIDQDYYVSWNNKIAPGTTTGGWGIGSIYRVNLLDRRVKALVDSGTKVTRVALTQAMEDAALTDLRGEDVLPTLLKVIDTAPVTDPTQQAALTSLRGWLADGAKRQETTAGSKTYADSAAIRLMDAWWPLLAQAEFEPGMGSDLYTALTSVLTVDETPGGSHSGLAHQGSAFQSGWWSWVDADLRTVLGQKVGSGLGATFCGNGSLTACRTALLTSLSDAAAEPAGTVYPATSSCAAGDQWCSDSIIMSPLGGITHPAISWQNRPTFQQVVQFPAGRGDNLANLALGRPATASSYQHGFLSPSYPASNATDGNQSTRWASNWSDDQQITVDLGSARTVGRVLLRWESAYASGYRIQVSTDGVTYRTVSSTTAGSGGTENVGFTPTTARYVRMLGVKRATGYGYSLYEFEVYAS